MLHLVADSRATFTSFMEYTVTVVYFYHFLLHVAIVRLIAIKIFNRSAALLMMSYLVWTSSLSLGLYLNGYSMYYAPATQRVHLNAV